MVSDGAPLCVLDEARVSIGDLTISIGYVFKTYEIIEFGHEISGLYASKCEYTNS